MVERIKSVLNGFFAVDKKLKIVVIAGIIGIFVLMLTEYIPSSVKQEEEAERQDKSDDKYCRIRAKRGGTAEKCLV